MNFAESEIAKLLSSKLGEAGRVTHLALGAGSIRMTLELSGQGAPVDLFAEGITWTKDGDMLVVRWKQVGSSLTWAHSLLQTLAEKAHHEIRLPDSLRMAPLKLILPKA
jgi:hypothetical protein